MDFKHKVTTIITDAEGNVVFEEVDHNAVTVHAIPAPDTAHNGLVWILDTIFAASDTYDPDMVLNKMEIGTGEASDTGLEIPYGSAPTTTRIAFNAAATLDYTTRTAPTATVQCDWDSSFAELTDITEVVLMSDDSSDYAVLAYKNYSTALSKDTAGTLSISWEITLALGV